MSSIDALRKHLSFAKPALEALFSLEARLAEWWAAGANHRLFLAQWGILPVPEFFEHKIGLYWMWKAKRSPHWVERGVFSLLAMKPGCKALELCCGDGFNAHYFYSARVGSMLSVDFDPKAIAYARRNFCAENISYHLADIRTEMPEERSITSFGMLRLNISPRMRLQASWRTSSGADADRHGIGAPRLPPLAPAIGNAIAAATGKRARQGPGVICLRPSTTLDLEA